MSEFMGVALVEQDQHRTAMVPTDVENKLKSVQRFQALVKEHLAEGFDYGVIPGTQKPTLLKAGAEKIITLFEARPHFEVVEKIEMWDSDKPIFYYHYRCQIIHVATGLVIGEGEGSCNSKEDKYAYRWVYPQEVPDEYKYKDQASGKMFVKPDCPLVKKFRGSKGGGGSYVYRIDNAEPFSLINTIQKMAQKRAMVAASLVLGRLSDLFTQDLEDLRDYDEATTEEEFSKKSGAPAQSKQPETSTATAGTTPAGSPKTEGKGATKSAPKKSSASEPAQAPSQTAGTKSSSTPEESSENGSEQSLPDSKKFVAWLIDTELTKYPDAPLFKDNISAYAWIAKQLFAVGAVDSPRPKLTDVLTNADSLNAVDFLLSERYGETWPG